MPKTKVNCPNCRQPVMADIDQLFDVNEDPAAKQRLLSGSFNIVQCPSCGYQGNIATPLIYHDPQKELLLTFFPPELNMPMQEQERMIGPLINQVVNRLPQEQRKGYLLRPQTMLTMQGMAERILEADGITKEMLQNQQKRLALIQRLAGATSDDVINEIVKQEGSLMDREFFAIFNRLVESALMGGDENSARRLADLQKRLLPLSEAGREIEQQSKEVEAAIKSLQELGQGLTREKLLDLFQEAPSPLRQEVLTSLARPGMDYEFFQLLSERIEKAEGDEGERLTELRTRLLDLTREVDQQLEERAGQSRQFLQQLLEQENIEEATEQNMGGIDDFFVRILNEELNEARKRGDMERIQKLNRVAGVLERASQPPPEVAFIEQLLEAPDDQARRAFLEAHKDEVTPELTDTLTGLLAQVQANGDEEMLAALQTVYRLVLRFSMEQNLQK